HRLRHSRRYRQRPRSQDDRRRRGSTVTCLWLQIRRESLKYTLTDRITSPSLDRSPIVTVRPARLPPRGPAVPSLRAAQTSSAPPLSKQAIQRAKTENFVALRAPSDILTISSSQLSQPTVARWSGEESIIQEGMGYDESRIDGAGPD